MPGGMRGPYFHIGFIVPDLDAAMNECGTTLGSSGGRSSIFHLCSWDPTVFRSRELRPPRPDDPVTDVDTGPESERLFRNCPVTG